MRPPIGSFSTKAFISHIFVTYEMTSYRKKYLYNNNMVKKKNHQYLRVIEVLHKKEKKGPEKLFVMVHCCMPTVILIYTHHYIIYTRVLYNIMYTMIY